MIQGLRRWWGYFRWRLAGSPVHDGAPSITEWQRLLNDITPPRSTRLISVIVANSRHRNVLASLRSQSHRHWELLLPAGIEAGVLQGDARVTRIPTPADAITPGLGSARGDLVVVVGANTTLTQHALAWFASVPPDVDLAYGDHVVTRGRAVAVRLKPAWSPHLLQAENYIGSTFAVSTRRLKSLPSVTDPWSLLLRLAAEPLRVSHLPTILGEEMDAGAPSGEVVRSGFETSAAGTPRVKVVIPTRDRVDLLAKAVAGVRRAVGVAAHLVIVDNGSQDPESFRYLDMLAADSRVTIVRVDEPFNFSRLINRGARSGPDAEYLLLLNNDIEMTDDGWLAGLCGRLRDPAIVAVGPKLVFSDGRIQHAGMVFGLGGIAGHYALGEWEVPEGSPPDLTREVSCLTGACLLVRMRDFEAVGALDEAFAEDFQDVDLCLRLRHQLGGDLLYDPSHPLIHIQMATRDPSAAGSEVTIAQMRAKWGVTLDAPDEFWNPHLSLVPPGRGLARLPDDTEGLRRRLEPRIRSTS